MLRLVSVIIPIIQRMPGVSELLENVIPAENTTRCIARAAARIAFADVRGDRDFQTRLIARKERLEVTLVGVILAVQTCAGILEPTNRMLLTAEYAA